MYHFRKAGGILRRFIILVFSVVFLMTMSACSKPESQADRKTSPLDGTYYCERVMLYDADGNLKTFYSSSNLGSENTYMTISEGKDIEFAWYYHGEADDILNGSIRNIEKEDDMSSGDVLFEGVADKYTLAYKTAEDSETISSLSLVYPFGENGNQIGLLFKKDKQAPSSGTYEDLEDIENQLGDFETSETCRKIKEAIENGYANMAHELSFDPDQKEYVLSVNIDGIAGNLGKSSQLDSVWDELCQAFDNNSSAFQTVINTGGYRGIRFLLKAYDGDTELYRSENGERVYVYEPADTDSTVSNTTPSAGNSGTAGSQSSFEQSGTFREIKSAMESSFPDSNPKVTYREKDKMLTVTLTGGKNWEEAILNDSTSYANWIAYTSSLMDVSESGYDVLCDAGYSDIAFTIMVLSYNDTSKALYACMNGVTYYDFTTD